MNLGFILLLGWLGVFVVGMLCEGAYESYKEFGWDGLIAFAGFFVMIGVALSFVPKG